MFLTSHPLATRFARTGVLLLGAGAVLGAALAVAPAATAKAASTGDFAVTVNGTTYNPAPGRDVKLEDVRPGTARIQVRGVHVGFAVDPATFGVYDYTLTGAANPDRMVTTPTVIFSSKVPTLTPAQTAGARISRLEVKDDSLVLILQTGAGKLKVQAKDAPTGGIFQMEPEFGGTTEVVHTLGPTLFYFVNPFTGKINFGNGVGPDSTHQMLLGKDSPQVATKTYQDGAVTKWVVTSGGRVGGVLGEDAIELSQGATNCTQNCQAQNRIRGSLPVPPLPTNPTPIGG
ncbi:hypothetical protein ACXR2U_02240 [Jatrophihabitans sp. YIM 134969]